MTDSLVANRFRTHRRLGSGSFGEIFVGVDQTTGSKVAMKFERQNLRCPQLRHEFKVYRELKGCKGICNVSHYGTHVTYNVMVLELLGPSLEELFTRCGRKFSLKTTLKLADQMLERVETLHCRHLIHRDIKPANFVMGDSASSSTVYCIDFGLSKRYRNPHTMQHIAYRTGKSLTGTPRYASISNHQGIEQSRRDDLEAVGYVLVYFLRGRLPWQGLKAKSAHRKYKLILEKKQEISIATLCAGCPGEFSEYLSYCRCLGFEKDPDVPYLRGLFRHLYKAQGYDLNNLHTNDWDWMPRSQASANPSSNETHCASSGSNNNAELLSRSRQGQPVPPVVPTAFLRAGGAPPPGGAAAAGQHGVGAKVQPTPRQQNAQQQQQQQNIQQQQQHQQQQHHHHQRGGVPQSSTSSYHHLQQPQQRSSAAAPPPGGVVSSSSRALGGPNGSTTQFSRAGVSAQQALSRTSAAVASSNHSSSHRAAAAADGAAHYGRTGSSGRPVAVAVSANAMHAAYAKPTGDRGSSSSLSFAQRPSAKRAVPESFGHGADRARRPTPDATRRHHAAPGAGNNAGNDAGNDAAAAAGNNTNNNTNTNTNAGGTSNPDVVSAPRHHSHQQQQQAPHHHPGSFGGGHPQAALHPGHGGQDQTQPGSENPQNASSSRPPSSTSNQRNGGRDPFTRAGADRYELRRPRSAINYKDSTARWATETPKAAAATSARSSSARSATRAGPAVARPNNPAAAVNGTRTVMAMAARVNGLNPPAVPRATRRAGAASG